MHQSLWRHRSLALWLQAYLLLLWSRVAGISSLLLLLTRDKLPLRSRRPRPSRHRQVFSVNAEFRARFILLGDFCLRPHLRLRSLCRARPSMARGT
jgi:hypothetical protein